MSKYKTKKETQKQQLNIHSVIQSTLKLKETQYKEVCTWFENEYNISSDKDEVAEWEKKYTEVNAQIKLLRHLIIETLPKFVKLNNIVLKLLGKKYYCDGSKWSVGYKIIDGVLLSWTHGTGMPWLHKQPLIEITEEEWRVNNKQYTPNVE